MYYRVEVHLVGGGVEFKQPYAGLSEAKGEARRIAREGMAEYLDGVFTAFGPGRVLRAKVVEIKEDKPTGGLTPSYEWGVEPCPASPPLKLETVLLAGGPGDGETINIPDDRRRFVVYRRPAWDYLSLSPAPYGSPPVIAQYDRTKAKSRSGATIFLVG